VKILEKITVRRLTQYETEHALLLEYIYGFKIGSSAEILLNDLTCKITIERGKRKYVILLSMDIKAA